MTDPGVSELTHKSPFTPPPSPGESHQPKPTNGESAQAAKTLVPENETKPESPEDLKNRLENIIKKGSTGELNNRAQEGLMFQAAARFFTDRDSPLALLPQLANTIGRESTTKDQSKTGKMPGLGNDVRDMVIRYLATFEPEGDESEKTAYLPVKEAAKQQVDKLQPQKPFKETSIYTFLKEQADGKKGKLGRTQEGNPTAQKLLDTLGDDPTGTPDSATESMLTQMAEAQDQQLMAAFVQRLTGLDTADPEQKAKFLASAKHQFKETFIPLAKNEKGRWRIHINERQQLMIQLMLMAYSTMVQSMQTAESGGGHRGGGH